jgi:hypothetical protein
MSDPVIVSAKAAASACTEVLPAVATRLPEAVVYSNLARYDRRVREGGHHRLYRARQARLSPVDLVWWPGGTVVFGADGFPARVGDSWVDEQFPPWYRDDPHMAGAALAAQRNLEDIGQECLLLARFGEGTWGHWLGELLPRAVLAESAYPGRFSYAVPAWTTIPGSPGLSTSVLESMRAYGIGEDRLVRLETDRNYRFQALATVTSVRSDGAMHPGALALMRSHVRVGSPAFGHYLPARVASLRTGVGRRHIANAGPVARELARRGFLRVEFETLSFAQQVAVLRSSSALFCVLGSGLTGVIYSPDHIKVVAPAPVDWKDNFFYPLIQARAGQFADVRGPIHVRDPIRMRDSSFRVRLYDLSEALSALGLD